MARQPATLFIISAPSGAGKTSLVKGLLETVDRLSVSVSHTTRPQRMGETQLSDYCFISESAFMEMVEKGAFLEHARVFDHYYGTSHQMVADKLAQHTDVILEIDWQGAQQVRKAMPESVSIFVLPPSRRELSRRLQDRGQDRQEVINKRMEAAVSEMSHYAEYDYLIVNDDFNKALSDLKSIILAKRLEFNVQMPTLLPLIHELLSDEQVGG